MIARHGEDEPFVSGFIGIIVIRTELEATGNRHGIELIRYLNRMHAGMAWYAGLQFGAWQHRISRHAAAANGLLRV